MNSMTRFTNRLIRHFSCRALLLGLLANLLAYSAQASVVPPADNDTITRTLAEVTVQARKEIHTEDSDIIFLSSENRRFGTNALDAISSLRQFMPTLDGLSLKTADLKDVFIMINGRPASAQELRGYTGKEIRKVTYYPIAPPRYADYTDGPVVDVTVRPDRNSIYAYLSASNSLNIGYGTDQALVRWADSLNMIRADYFIDYRNMTYRNSDSYSFLSAPALNQNYNTSSKYNGHLQYGKLYWQNTAGGNLISVSAMYTHAPAKRKYLNTPEDNEDEASGKDAYSRTLDNLSDIGNLNLYYTRRIGKGGLDVQATGSIGKTSSTNLLDAADGMQAGSEFVNHTYVGYGKIMYHTPVKRVNLFTSGSYRYQHTGHRVILPHEYQYGSDDNNLNLSASASGQFVRERRKLGYTLGVTFNHRKIRSHHLGVDMTEYNFNPSLTLSATLSGRLFMRLRGAVTSGVPAVGQLSDLASYQEQNLLWRGNPELSGWRAYSVKWQPQLTAVPGIFTINGDFSFRYATRPVGACVTGDSPVEVKYVNLDGRRDGEAVMIMSVSPIKSLSFKPYIQWTYTSYSTPSREVERGYMRYGGSIMFNRSKVQAVLSVNAPYKTFNGDITEYGGWQLSGSVLVKLPRNLSVSLAWNHSYQADRSVIYAPGIIEQISRSCVPRLANQITLGLTWSFSHGIFKRRQQAGVEDINPDSGISGFNEVKR